MNKSILKTHRYSIKNNYAANTHVSTTEVKKQNTATTTEAPRYVSHSYYPRLISPVTIILTHPNFLVFLMALPTTYNVPNNIV